MIEGENKLCKYYNSLNGKCAFSGICPKQRTETDRFEAKVTDGSLESGRVEIGKILCNDPSYVVSEG